MNEIKDASKGIVIYGPQGCGKTTNAEALKTHFGKSRIIEGFAGLIAEDTEGGVPLLPDDAILLTNLSYEQIIDGKDRYKMNIIHYEQAIADLPEATPPSGQPVVVTC